MADDSGDRPRAGLTGVPQFAGALEARPERLALLLGYGPNPYETPEARALTEDFVTRLGHGVAQAVAQSASDSLKDRIAAAVVAAGAARELVVIFSMVAALQSVATRLALNPPNALQFDHIQPDTLRRFRAHLWDTIDIGNALQRKLLDDYRAEEIRRRRS